MTSNDPEPVLCKAANGVDPSRSKLLAQLVLRAKLLRESAQRQMNLWEQTYPVEVVTKARERSEVNKCTFVTSDEATRAMLRYRAALEAENVLYKNRAIRAGRQPSKQG